MSVMNEHQIWDLLAATGWPEADRATAIAIALAESGGNTAAQNKNSTATGLFQIMFSVWVKDPEVRKLGVQGRYDLLQAGLNSRVALVVKRKQGWGAWAVYNSGAYKKFLARGEKAAKDGPNRKSPIEKGVDNVVPDVDTLKDIGSTAKDIATKGGVLVAALVFVVLGVVILLSQSKVGKTVAKAVPVVGKVI